MLPSTLPSTFRDLRLLSGPGEVPYRASSFFRISPVGDLGSAG
jgi:hypothetical protein